MELDIQKIFSEIGRMHLEILALQAENKKLKENVPNAPSN